MLFFALLALPNLSIAQCSIFTPPTYTGTCSGQYFTSIVPNATGITSTIAVSGITSCTGNYFDYFNTQGIVSPAGNLIFLDMNRTAGATAAYVSVYIDWNNNGTYDLTERAGTTTLWPLASSSLSYSFYVPTSGVVTGTHLHMRVMLSTSPDNMPCTGAVGQTYDFYFQSNTCTPPTVNATPRTIAVCEGAPASAMVATGGSTYAWYPSSSVSPSVGASVFAAPAATTVYTVVGLSLAGCPDTALVTYVVNPNPAPITGTTPICALQTSVLSSLTPGGIWSLSDSTPAAINPTGVVTGIDAGVTTVTYKLPTGCYTTFSMTIDRVIPTITISSTDADNRVCVGDTVSYTFTTTNEGTTPTYIWKKNGVEVSTLPFYTYVPYNGDVIICELTSNERCAVPDTAVDTVIMTVLPPASPFVSVASTAYDSVCSGTSITLSAAPIHPGTAPAYQWYLNGSPTSVTNSYTFVPVSGNSVSLRMISNAECRVYDTAFNNFSIGVVDYQTPTVNVSAFPADSVCQGAYVTYTAAVTWPGLAPSYVWRVNGSIVGTGLTYTYDPLPGDVVSFEMVSNYPCVTVNTVTVTQDVKVRPVPVPVVTINVTPGIVVAPGANANFTATVTGGSPFIEYQWYVNGFPVPGAMLNYFITNSLNDYDSVACVVTDYGYCRDFSVFGWVRIFIRSNTNVGDLAADLRSVTVSPNPSKGQYNVSYYGIKAEALTVDIMDMTGRVVTSQVWDVKQGDNSLPINITELATGVYFTKVASADGNNVVIKIIKE